MLGTGAKATICTPRSPPLCKHTHIMPRLCKASFLQTPASRKQPPRSMHWKAGTLLLHTQGTSLQLSAKMSSKTDFHEESICLLMCPQHPGERQGGGERTATAQNLCFFILRNPLSPCLFPVRVTGSFESTEQT